jgi:hypothetical protein
MQKGGAVMKRSLSQGIGYLFDPEDSAGENPRTMPMPPPGRKYLAGVSFKAVFWAGTAIAAALMIGRLS